MSEVETLGLSDGTGTGVGTWHFAFGVETHSAMQSVAVAFSQTYSVQKLQSPDTERVGQTEETE